MNVERVLLICDSEALWVSSKIEYNQTWLETFVLTGERDSQPVLMDTVTSLTFAGEALYVEVVGLDPQHLSSAGLSAFEALDDPLPHIGVAAILGV